MFLSLIYRLMALSLAGLLATACASGYETETRRREGIKEWFLDMPWGRVEAYAIWPPQERTVFGARRFIGTKRFPALLLLHAAGGRAQRFRRAMFSLVRENIVVMSISLPGHGESTGPEDFAGPRSVKAALRAVDYLSGRWNVRPEAIALYGYGVGAAVALLTASKNPKIRLIAVENGFYDLAKTYGRFAPQEQVRLRRIIGGDPSEKKEGYRLRSPIRQARNIKGKVLIIHSRNLKRFPLAEAEALAQELKRSDKLQGFTQTKSRGRITNPSYPRIKRLLLPIMQKSFGKAQK